MNNKVFVSCAVTGSGDSAKKNPDLPKTPEQIAKAAIAAAKAGAAIAHIHVRENDGKPSRRLELYKEVVDRVRSSGTYVVLNLTTGMGGDLDMVTYDIVTTSNRDIDIIPHGTGDVNLGADAVQIGDNNANATLTTQGTGDLILNTNNGTNAGSITLLDGANGEITLTPNGTGVVAIEGSMNPSVSSTGKALVMGF